MPTYTDYVDKVQQQYANPSATDNIKPDKYVIKSHTYPSDLGSQDLQHFVLFNINVSGKSTFDSKKLFPISRAESSGGLTSEQLGQGAAVGAGVAAAVVAGVAVTSLVKNATKAVDRTGGTRLQALARTAARNAPGAILGAGVGLAAYELISASALLKPDTTHRITDAIALYVDGPPVVRYNMNYATKDLGTLVGLLSGSVLDSKKSSGAAEAAAAIGMTMAKLPGAFGGGDLASAIAKSSGTALNPFKEVVFESVDFRSFNFKYKFFPKNKIESDSVNNIVNLFKEHMHPELSDGRLFFIAPSQFQITYYFDSAPNRYFHKFKPCALESMEVTFGGEQFSSFKDGTPTEVNMSLTFRELEILTRASIKEGY